MEVVVKVGGNGVEVGTERIEEKTEVVELAGAATLGGRRPVAVDGGKEDKGVKHSRGSGLEVVGEGNIHRLGLCTREGKEWSV